MNNSRFQRRRGSARRPGRSSSSRLLLIALLPGMLASVAAPAVEVEPAGGLTLSNAWVRAMPPGQSMTAAYMQISNGGSTSVTINGVTADRGMASLHETRTVDGRSSMHPVPMLALRPGESAQLQPGGLHVMLMGLERTPAPGETLSICVLSDAGKSCTEAAVQRGPVVDDSGAQHHH